MKYYILISILIVLSVMVSPMAVDRLNENSNTDTGENIFMASSGGNSPLSAALSERGKLFTVDSSTGTLGETFNEKGQHLDIELINKTHIAYLNRYLDEDGTESELKVIDSRDGKLENTIDVSENLNDFEYQSGKFLHANSSGVFSVKEGLEEELDTKSKVTDLEYWNKTAILAFESGEVLIMEDERKNFSLNRIEDLEVLDLNPLNILAAHKDKAAEYKLQNDSLEEVWQVKGLNSGRSIERLPDNTTVISEREGVFAVNETGRKIWEKEYFTVSDIETSQKDRYSLENYSVHDPEAYWVSETEPTLEDFRPKSLTGFFSERLPPLLS